MTKRLRRNRPAARFGLMMLFWSLTVGFVCAVPPESNPPQNLPLGQEVFLTYCAGCHGFDGMAFYPPAPSFAMGERLVKSDLELMSSILKGRNAMPSWESKLPMYWLEQALAYIRHMAQKENINVPNNWDGRYFIFAPPGTDPTMDWRIP